MKLNHIYNQDCIQGMKEHIPDNSVDCIITSPPYNIGIWYDSWDDRMKWDDYWKFTYDWLMECFRVLKEDGRICINHYLSVGSGRKGFKNGLKQGNEQAPDDGNGLRVAPLFEIHRIATEIGFKHHGIAIWTDITLSKKTAWGSWLSASSPYINSPYEGILIMYKKDWKRYNPGKSTIKSSDFVRLTRGVWDMHPVSGGGLTKANFPIDLPTNCINLLTFTGDIVLDPFMGSGTTAEACIRLHRKYIGFEISKKYCKIMRCRTDQKRLF